MKQFLAFIRKEFYHILRDTRTIMILLLMPVIQIVLFGFAISTEVKNIRTVVLTPDYDMTVQQIVDKLGANEYFQIVQLAHSPEDIQQAFRQGKADLAIIFPHQYSNHIYQSDQSVQIMTDASEPNLAVMRSNYAQHILSQAETQLRGMNTAPAVVSNIQLLYNPQMKSAYNFVPGVMGLILMLICAMMTSISIVREKETGTMEILLVSPAKPLSIILSKAVPYFLLSIINLTTILLLSRFVLHVPIAGSLPGLLAVSLLFILVSLALGLLISSITEKQVVALLISGMVLMIPTILLSGMIFTIESMPPVLQYISNLIPARWYIELVRKIMIEGVPLRLLYPEISILVIMGCFFVVITYRRFKSRLN